ncbi:MAG: DUF4238 domain-containing protein [Sulfuritalea sp.]|nr:DUF4238 domain-containing protein [Sulfuritalea sp.]
MERGTNKAKMHHFVPRSYLARFADDQGFVHVYDRNTRSLRRQRPKNVMKINSYYRQEWAPEGVDPNIMEMMLGEWLEAEAKGAIDRLIEAPAQLTDDDTANLMAYIELQRTRVPRQAATAKALMRATILRIAPPAAVKAITSGEVQLKIKDSARFDYMRMMVGMLSPWFGRMEWEVFEADGGASFIATDSPVSFYNSSILPPAEAGIGLAGTMVFFPLSSRHTLVMRHPEYSQIGAASPLDVLPTPKHEDGQIPIIHGAIWSREVVDNFNWKLVQLSSRLIVAESSEVLSRCISKKGESIPSVNIGAAR